MYVVSLLDYERLSKPIIPIGFNYIWLYFYRVLVLYNIRVILATLPAQMLSQLRPF